MLMMMKTKKRLNKIKKGKSIMLSRDNSVSGS